MRQTILILFSFLSTSHLFGQHDSLLRKFKYRVDHYQEINFGLNGGSQASQMDLITGRYKSSGAVGHLDGNYYFIKSTDTKIVTLAAGAGINHSWSKTENPTGEDKSHSFSGMSGLSVLNRWFRGKLFAELGTDLSGNYYSDKNTSNNPTGNSKYTRYDYHVAINTGIGKGRLENITDMQNALWLYKELQSEKKLSRSLSDDELDELGRTITKANNTRVLDARKRTQYILETTDQYFQQKKVLTDADIRYFSTLNDILFFAINNSRLSGTELFIRLTSAIDNASRKEFAGSPDPVFRGKFENSSVVLATGVNRYMPVNLRHQNNYGVSLNLEYGRGEDSYKFLPPTVPSNDVDLNRVTRQAEIKLFFQHAIYPNTRTVLGLNFNSETGYQHVDSENSFYGMADISASVNYFISYRTRLTCNIGGHYQANAYGYSYYHELELLPDSFLFFANAGIQVSL